MTVALPMAVALLLLATSALAGSIEERYQSDPAAWGWYYGVTESDINAVLAKGYRIVEMDVESANPYRYTVAVVQNSGPYAKAWWWWTLLTFDEVNAKLKSLNARLIRAKLIAVAGGLRYAVVMVS